MVMMHGSVRALSCPVPLEGSVELSVTRILLGSGFSHSGLPGRWRPSGGVLFVLTIQPEAARVTHEALGAQRLFGGGSGDVLLVPLVDFQVAALVAREAVEQAAKCSQGLFL